MRRKVEYSSLLDSMSITVENGKSSLYVAEHWLKIGRNAHKSEKRRGMSLNGYMSRGKG